MYDLWNFLEVFWYGKLTDCRSLHVYSGPIICGILHTYNLDRDSHFCPTVVSGVYKKAEALTTGVGSLFCNRDITVIMIYITDDIDIFFEGGCPVSITIT